MSRIKRAYKKKALLLHPDRNYGDVENATQRFAEVQSAYEVLSDPQERSWYDSHREAILRGASADDVHDHAPEFNNIKLTTTEDLLFLIRRFNSTVPFTDDPGGFFGIASETFAHLADEEAAAGEYGLGDQPDYPPFGESSDSYDPVVKAFYAGWAGFSTRKTFAWKDKYRLSDAPDRRTRRLMEKENKKFRDDAVRDFNDAVRFLVTFVRKRDPRYLPNQQSDAERQASMRNAAAAQAARSRAANQKRFNEESIPSWVQPQSGENNETGYFSESDDESEVEQIECVVCDKTFKSEKSYEAHERSKKHIKAVQQLRRQMRKEGADLDIDTPKGAETPEEAPINDASHRARDTDNSTDGEPQDTLSEPELPKSTHSEEAEESSAGAASSASLSDDDDYVPRAAVEERLVSHDSDDPVPSLHDLSVDEAAKTGGDGEGEGNLQAPQKMGKAKEKRAKKAARGAKTGTHEVGIPSRS